MTQLNKHHQPTKQKREEAEKKKKEKSSLLLTCALCSSYSFMYLKGCLALSFIIFNPLSLASMMGSYETSNSWMWSSLMKVS
jgi:hypothetical protein